jgi:phospholipid/cholesterol/gamma-HCH transport system substrate-binding protein
VVFYLLTGGTLLQTKATLYLYIPDATGVGNTSPVRVDGIDVGKVDRVALSGDTRPDRIVKVTIIVERQWLSKIPVDSYAEIAADTLIGDKFVAVTSGPSRTPILPNGEIPFKDQPDVLKRLDLHQFEEQLRVVAAQITDIEQARGLVGQFVQGTGMYDEWRKLLRESQKGMDAMAAREGTLGSQVYNDREYQAIRHLIQGVEQALARLQAGQGDYGRFLRDDAQYRQLSAALADLRQSIASLRGSSFFQSAADYGDWSRQLSGLIRTVDEFNASPPMATSEVYDSLSGMTRELQHTMRDFRLDPRKYLRLKVF